MSAATTRGWSSPTDFTQSYTLFSGARRVVCPTAVGIKIRPSRGDLHEHLGACLPNAVDAGNTGADPVGPKPIHSGTTLAGEVRCDAPVDL